MERKLRKSYLMMFPLFILTLTLIVAIGTWVSAAYIRPSMASFQHTAGRLLEEGLRADQIEDIVQDGGGILVVHKNGQVEQVAGKPIWDGNHMSIKELTDFFVSMNSPSAPYKYSVAYDEENESWLIVGFPVSMRIQIIFAANHASKEYGKALLFYIALLCSLMIALFFFAWCYARKSAKAYSVPLQKVCDSVRQIANGNYQVERQKIGIEEYESLQNDVMTLAFMLEEERKTTKQVEESKRQMLLDISHDLRNPLATILGYAENLYHEEKLSDKERETYIEVIYRNSERAHDLMHDLFEYTRLDKPKLKIQMESVDLCEFLREFIASYVPDIESAGFESEFDIPEEERYVLLDEKQMGRALGNIVQNSLRYNSSGTRLMIALMLAEDMAELHIRDNGVGIEAALCELIFLPFTRVDKARNPKHGGSGLGLSISKKIIEAHGGKIRLNSDKNQGCDFEIMIPLDRDKEKCNKVRNIDEKDGSDPKRS